MANPHHDTCPNYLLPEFKEAHLLFTVEGKTNAQAATLLRNIWDFNNNKAIETWDQRRAEEIEAQQENRERLEQEEKRTHLLREQEEEQAKLEEHKKYKTKFTPIPDRPLPPTSLLLPLQHALNKLCKGDYVPLFFFTNKDIREAEEDGSGDEDPLTLVQTDKGPTFQTTASAKAKKHKVKDDHLSWEEFSQAGYRMIAAMREQEWPEERVNMVCNFWIAFEMHTWRHDPSKYRKRALLLYTYAAKIDTVPTVRALPHCFPTAQTNDYVFLIFFPSLRSALFSPFPPPLFYPPMPIPALYAGVSPPMRISSRMQAQHVITLPPTLPHPTSLNGNGWPHYGVSSPRPHCTWHTTVLSPRPTAMRLSPSDYQPTPAVPGNPNTCATPVSPSAPSPHPPENRLMPRTLRNRGPFGMTHKQTVSWDHHPTTPPSYSPFVPSALGITDTACRLYNAQPGEPGTTNTTPTVKGSTKPYTSGTSSTTLCSLWQRDCSCHDKHDHMHLCSGCGALTHGASRCPRAQKAPPANAV